MNIFFHISTLKYIDLVHRKKIELILKLHAFNNIKCISTSIACQIDFNLDFKVFQQYYYWLSLLLQDFQEFKKITIH